MLILFVLQALQPDPVLSQNGPLVSYGEAVVAYLANHGIPGYTMVYQQGRRPATTTRPAGILYEKWAKGCANWLVSYWLSGN